MFRTLLKALKDKIPGGLSDNKKPSDFDPKAVKQGKRVESEHTSDPAIAAEIARDHLTEDPKYYDKLKTIEKSNYGPKGGGQYTAHHNQKRKEANASDIDTGIQGIKVKSGANASGAQGKQKLNAEVRALHAKNKKQPVKVFSEEEKAAYQAKLNAQPKKLAASEPGMQKGAMKRLAPFDPQETPKSVGDTMEEWQGGEQEQNARNKLGEIGMDPNAKTRALHRLHGVTAVRRAPDGGREFLLHRGMSGDEYHYNKTGDRMHHTETSSWTPDIKVASQFGEMYRDQTSEGGDAKKKGGIVSAWVHEKHINFVPKQHGNLAADYENHGKQTKNHFANEHEVLVAPNHRSKMVPKHELPGLIGQINRPKSVGVEDARPQNPNQMINQRVKNIETRGPEMGRAKNKQMMRDVGVDRKLAQQPKKLAASDPMGMVASLKKTEHPGKLKDKEFKAKDKAVDSAGRAHDRKPTAQTHAKLTQAISERDKHIQSNPETKKWLNQLNAHMNHKYGGNRPMIKSDSRWVDASKWVAKAAPKLGVTSNSHPEGTEAGQNKGMNTQMGHHIIFSAENSPYPDKVKSKASHAEVLQFLKDKGEDAHEVQGHYGSPEKSIIVHNPKKPDHIKRLAHVLGQESVIHSNGTNHRLEYLHGEHAGKYVEGTGTVWHNQKPNDLYTSLPDGRHFTHNLDFSTMKHIPIMSQTDVKARLSGRK